MQTLVQVIDGLVVDGVELPVALQRPRWRSQDGRVLVERSFPRVRAFGLRDRGHLISRLPDGAGVFGAVVAVGVDRRAGTVFAAADPRWEISAMGW